METFNYLTPYELALHMETYVENQTTELRERLTLVWLGEYYHRTKKLPNLRDELKKIGGNQKKQAMTNEQMLAVVRRLNQQFGGKSINPNEGS